MSHFFLTAIASGAFAVAAFGASAEEQKPKRKGFLTYTVTMLGDASGATGEQKWTSKTNRVLKGRIPLEFWTDFSVEADLKANEEARARRAETATPPAGPPPALPPSLTDAMQRCANQLAGMMTCIQEAAAKICEKASGEEKESACALARNMKLAQDTPIAPRPKPQPLARNGEIWRGKGCEFTTTVDDQAVGTRPYDPLTRGPYVSKSFTKANWTGKREDTCADVSLDKIAKTIKLILPLPRDVKGTIRYESPVQTMEEAKTLAPFKDAGLPGRSGDAMEVTTDLTDLKSMSGSGTYKPKGESGTSSVQTTLEWSVTFD
jgi:hypothetical protein